MTARFATPTITVCALPKTVGCPLFIYPYENLPSMEPLSGDRAERWRYSQDVKQHTLSALHNSVDPHICYSGLLHQSV